MSERAQKLLSSEGRLEMLAEIHAQLSECPDDAQIKALRAQQSGIRTASDIANVINLEKRIGSLEVELHRTRSEIGADRGGVSRANNTIAFVVPGERIAHEDN